MTLLIYVHYYIYILYTHTCTDYVVIYKYTMHIHSTLYSYFIYIKYIVYI